VSVKTLKTLKSETREARKERAHMARAVDRALKDFGYPVGPVALLDEVGIDVGAHVAKDFDVPEALTIMQRGMLWASR